jgi:hypothetical protein
VHPQYPFRGSSITSDFNILRDFDTIGTGRHWLAKTVGHSCLYREYEAVFAWMAMLSSELSHANKQLT